MAPAVESEAGGGARVILVSVAPVACPGVSLQAKAHQTYLTAAVVLIDAEVEAIPEIQYVEGEAVANLIRLLVESGV